MSTDKITFLANWSVVLSLSIDCDVFVETGRDADE